MVKRYSHFVTCCVIFAIAISVGLSADTTQASYQLPSDAQVIGYLLQSVNWYRHVYTEREVASDPGDLVFLNDNQALESQIVKLSFEFARADAALAKAATSPHDAPVTLAASSSGDLAHFIELKNQNDQGTQQTSADIAKLNEKIASAREADRKKLKAALDDAQSRLELLQAVSQGVNDLILFVQTARTAQDNTATLDLTIDDLAQSIPELSSPAIPLSKLPTQNADSKTSNGWRETGLLGLGSEVSALEHKRRVVDEKIRLTDNFLLSAKNIRTPMSGFITRVLQRAATSNLQTSDLSLLREQKSQLDALTFELKAFSPAIVALDKQKALLEEYESHLQPWRTAIAIQYREAWKRLVVRLLHRCADCRSAIRNGRDFASTSPRPHPGPKPTPCYKHGSQASDIVCRSRGRLVQRCLRLEFIGNLLWASNGRNGGCAAKRDTREPRLSRIDGEAWNQNWRSNTSVRHYRGCHQHGHAAIPVERIRPGGSGFHGSCRDLFEFSGFCVPSHWSAEV